MSQLDILSQYEGHFLNFACGQNAPQQGQSPAQDPRDKNFTAVFGALLGEKILAAAFMPNFVLFVASDYIEAQSALRQFNALGVFAVYLPYSDDALLVRRSLGLNFEHGRAAALARILSGEAKICVVCADAFCRFYPPKQRFLAQMQLIEAGKDYKISALAATLAQCGYKRAESVSEAGDFSVRGDIVDIFAPHLEKPVRLDFFDENLVSIKHINADLTTDKASNLAALSLFPLGDIFTEAEHQNAITEARRELKNSTQNRAALDRCAALISEAEALPSAWLSTFFSHSRIFEYLPSNAIIMLNEPRLLEEKLERSFAEHCMRFERLFAAGEVQNAHFANFIAPHDAFSGLKSFTGTAFMQFPYASKNFSPTRLVQLKNSPLINYKFNLKSLAQDVDNWLASGYRVILCAPDQAAVKRLTAQLEDFGMRLAPRFAVGLSLERGFVSHTAQLALIGAADSGVRPAERQSSKRSLAKTKRDVFLAPEKGDYVVHELHGVGLCEGIVSLSGSFGVRDFIAVRYRGDDLLYVPAESANLLSRYSGAEGGAVKLSKIGGAEFEQIKSKVKASLKQLSFDLVQLYAAREQKRGFTYQIDGYLTDEFAAAFEFSETDDQLRAINEIFTALQKNRIMDRLLVGDVGFGKTEVALRAAFAACSNGRQAALLAPTTILTQQHYNTAKKRFEHFDIKVECLNRFKSAVEQKAIIARAANGEVDLLIGTHRLLSKDISFKNLGILILDEEQRFGVEHKERIKTLKNNVDCLTLSATPIPRTLHMSLAGIRDISVLSEPPPGRLPVETFIVEESPPMLRDIIIREIARGGQVFVVYNRVETIDFFTAKLRALVPEAKICVGHGQMDERVLEKSVMDFSHGEFNVLVCTTIIENGIDMPHANTIVVFDCEMFGLSQLYQLRGRVGRGNVPAYAYFVYRPNKMLSEVQLKRLNSIMEHSELGSGFKIALRDLEIRGAGNVLGREQHGQLQKVGYEMYSRLMAQALAETANAGSGTGGGADGADGSGQAGDAQSGLHAAPSAGKTDTVMNMDFELYAPAGYISDAQSRVQFYQRASAITSADEALALRAELCDIYGAPPKEVENLLKVVTLKAYASRAGVSRITVRKNTAEIEFLTQKDLLREEVFASTAKTKLKCGFDKTKWQMSVYSPHAFSRDEFLLRLAELLRGFTLPALQTPQK